MDVLGSPSLTVLMVLMVSVDVKLTVEPSEPRSCVKVEVSVLGSLSLIVLMVSVDVKLTVEPLETRSCVKIEVAVLGSPFRIVRMVSVDVKQH